MDAHVGSHVRGVDSLRFVAAMWVAFGHGAWIPIRAISEHWGAFGQALSALSNSSFNGVAAVIVFFLISGFCIHLPYVGASKIDLRDFYLRRYIRIGGPLLIILAISQFWSDAAASAVKLVLWSVYCELAYYTLYPLLLPLLKDTRIKATIGVATLVAVALIGIRWSYLRHWQFGLLTFLVGYPTWLLGCLLAARIGTRKPIAEIGPIWIWRGIAWLYSIFAMIAVFHLPMKIGYPATLLVFSFYCFHWIQQELIRWRRVSPWRTLEAAGVWSYSIYLVHCIVIAKVVESPLMNAPILAWVLKITGILGFSFFYYQLVERPFHLLARRCARAFRPPAVGHHAKMTP